LELHHGGIKPLVDGIDLPALGADGLDAIAENAGGRKWAEIRISARNFCPKLGEGKGRPAPATRKTALVRPVAQRPSPNFNQELYDNSGSHQGERSGGSVRCKRSKPFHQGRVDFGRSSSREGWDRITVLEVAVASILATASEEQRAKVAAFLELANTGGLHSEASEYFLAGCEATTEKLRSLKSKRWASDRNYGKERAIAMARALSYLQARGTGATFDKVLAHHALDKDIERDEWSRVSPRTEVMRVNLLTIVLGAGYVAEENWRKGARAAARHYARLALADRQRKALGSD
jgi:hypothetical protein